MLVICIGVTRTTRIAQFTPGTLVRVDVIGRLRPLLQAAERHQIPMTRFKYGTPERCFEPSSR